MVVNDEDMNNFYRNHIHRIIYIRSNWLVVRVLGVLGSKPLGDSKVHSTLHPFEVDQTSTRTQWLKLVPPRNGSKASTRLNPIY